MPGGKREGAGRPAGSPNKLTRDVKAMIEGALDELGGQHYLVTQGTANPTAFLALLGKVLPKDINAKIDAGGELRAYLLKLAAERGL